VGLDHLGPMVVQTDGTLRRIANWDDMSKGEQETAMRVLTQRNRERLAALQAAGALPDPAHMGGPEWEGMAAGEKRLLIDGLGDKSKVCARVWAVGWGECVDVGAAASQCRPGGSNQNDGRASLARGEESASRMVRNPGLTWDPSQFEFKI